MDEGLTSGRRDAWEEATLLIARWLAEGERVEELLGRVRPGFPPVERARCQALVYGVLRHYGRIEAAVGRHVRRPPRNRVRAVLLVAGWELIDHLSGVEGAADPADEGRIARIVHHAVERAKVLASAIEARLVNAVVRKLAEDLAGSAPARLAPAAALAEYFSHPLPLVERWLARFGAGATRAFLEWNQKPATVHLRWRPSDGAEAAPDWLLPTPWEGFHEVPAGRWADVEALIRSGRAYVQDPATRLAVSLLAPRPGETVLDACAAPGGKGVLIADTIGSGRLVALDLPGKRVERLRENMGRVRGVEVSIVAGNLLRGVRGCLESSGQPTSYSAVMLDAPCTNTGVMRHRVDVKWRLEPGDFARHAAQQGALLRSAAGLVAPGGRLVYSTCSVDPEENEAVVESFLAEEGGRFALEESLVALPWDTGHDGAAAFRLRRKDAGAGG